MKRTIEIAQQFQPDKGNVEAFDDFLDRVLDEFDRIGIEADYLAKLTEKVALWTITVDAEEGLQALMKASTALRTALHAAGCGTEQWLTLDDLINATEVKDRGQDLASA